MSSVFADNILKGRVAFVTGGGTGITGGVARALAEAGANVALVSRRIEHLEPAAKAINEARERGSSPTVSEGSEINVGEAFAERLWHGGGHRSEGHLQCLSRRLRRIEKEPGTDTEHQRHAALPRHADAD